MKAAELHTTIGEKFAWVVFVFTPITLVIKWAIRIASVGAHSPAPAWEPIAWYGSIIGLAGLAFWHAFCLYDAKTIELNKIKSDKIELKTEFIYENPSDIGIPAFRLKVTNASSSLAQGVKVILEDITQDGVSVSDRPCWPLNLTAVPPAYSVGQYAPAYFQDINPGDYGRFEVAFYFVDEPNWKFIGLPPLAVLNRTSVMPGLIVWRPSPNLVSISMPRDAQKDWDFKMKISARTVPAFEVHVFLRFPSEDGRDSWSTPQLSVLGTPASA